MKKAIYIGMCQEGSTALMRYNQLSNILEGRYEVQKINIQKCIDETNKVLRTIGWRYKKGPLIQSINATILKEIDSKEFYEFIWVDKGVFIKEKVTEKLRKYTSKLIHFTPDPAFFYHQSSLFNKSLKFYDFVITTKSFEIEDYKKLFKGKIILTTQGYDEDQHLPLTNFNDKKFDFSFVGHFEINRAILIRQLLSKGYRIILAGPRWYLFSLFFKSKNLSYIGKYLKGEKYTKAISDAYMSIGFLSKWIPEQHTTRTFEIPACGTLLVTEKTKEIETFFSDEEVLFYNNFFELENGAKNLLLNKLDLHKKISSSRNKLNEGDFSHRKILIKLLNDTRIG